MGGLSSKPYLWNVGSFAIPFFVISHAIAVYNLVSWVCPKAANEDNKLFVYR